MSRTPVERGVGELATSLVARGIRDFDAAFVLGSGLGELAERLEERVDVAFAELEGMPRSGVPGHAGRVVVGRLRGLRVLAQMGRVHLYEGHSVHEVARSVRAYAALGCKVAILTNAAGGLRAEWPVPSLMRLADHLNLQGTTPLAREESGRARIYDPELGATLDAAARAARLELRRGVYASLCGPSYETPAEVAYLRFLGADAVGMSTVPEALAAYASGMRVGAVACIANHAAGIAPGPLSHEEVLAGSRAIQADFCRLLEETAARLSGLGRQPGEPVPRAR